MNGNGLLQTLTWPLLSTDAPRERGQESPVFLPGELVAERFRILRPLGSGGMGQVFEAADLQLGTSVALKVIRPQAHQHEMAETLFRQEVQLARQVTHPNVCRIFDLVVHSADPDDTPWGKSGRPVLALTMELLAGETLAARLAERGSLPGSEALALLGQMAAALEAAHGAGVCHCDFKPSNVMVTPTRAVVTDFGLASSPWHPPEDEERPLRGTPGYLAPEILNGADPSEAADLYAFGVVAHQMLTGRLPAEGPSALPWKWGMGAEEALRRALHPDPAQRFSRAMDLVEALRQSRRSAPSRWRQGWLQATLGLVCLILMTAILLGGGSPEPLRRPAEGHLEDARQAMGEVDYATARAAAQRAVFAAKATGDRTLEAEAQMVAAAALEAMGESTRADEALAEASRIFAAIGDQCGLARASLVFRDTWDQSRRPLPLPELPGILETCGDLSHQAMALARLLKTTPNIEDLPGQVSKAFDLAEKSRDPRALSEVWAARAGQQFFRDADLVAAEASFAKAVVHARRAGDPYLIAGMLSNQAHVLQDLGLQKEEEALLEEATTLARRVGNRYLQVRLLLGEAKLQQWRNLPAEALRTLERAHRIALDLGDSLMVCLSLEALAGFHARRQNWSVAVETREQLLAIWVHRGEDGHADWTRLRLARVLARGGKLEDAEALVEEVMQRYPLGETKGNIAIQSRTLRAQLYRVRGNAASAAVLLREVLPRLTTNQNPGVRRQASYLAVTLDRHLHQVTLVTLWQSQIAAAPLDATSPEQADSTLRLQTDLGRLLWFQGRPAEARAHLQRVREAAQSLGRSAIFRQIDEEIVALERWRDSWGWKV